MKWQELYGTTLVTVNGIGNSGNWLTYVYRYLFGQEETKEYHISHGNIASESKQILSISLATS